MLAKQQAIHLVKDQLQRQGVRDHSVPMRDIQSKQRAPDRTLKSLEYFVTEMVIFTVLRFALSIGGDRGTSEQRIGASAHGRWRDVEQRTEGLRPAQGCVRAGDQTEGTIQTGDGALT